MFRNNSAQVAIALDNRIVLKKVHILRDLGTEVEIAAGLGQDERIVINPPDSISDGEQVRVTQAASESRKSAEEIAQTGREHGE
jgi:hypothetical protein